MGAASAGAVSAAVAGFSRGGGLATAKAAAARVTTSAAAAAVELAVAARRRRRRRRRAGGEGHQREAETTQHCQPNRTLRRRAAWQRRKALRLMPHGVLVRPNESSGTYAHDVNRMR